PWTARLEERACAVFERDVAILPVATGTAANALALSLLAPPYGAILWHAQGHVPTDECGAPELMSGGAKLLALPGAAGRIDPGSVGRMVDYARSTGVHH